MPVNVILGGQWGDEGKGKIVDMLAENADMVVRFNGGDNAGHTVVNPHGEFRLHLIPSGIFHPRVTCIIGNGVAINPASLMTEIGALREHEISTSRLFISDRAHVIMPYHILLDSLEEKARGGSAIGTTMKGIGPAFADKVSRNGIRMCDLVNHEEFYSKLKYNLEQKNPLIIKLYGGMPLSIDEIYHDYVHLTESLAPYVRDTHVLLEEAVRRGDRIIMEGAQGAMLDPDFGTYPFVTSSPCVAGSAALGAGLSPTKIDAVFGVYKAYTTRVGGGPMVTELLDKTGEAIRERAKEYGATTGRPRRCGWLDGVAGRFSRLINDFKGITLTRLDVLDVFPQIKICTDYMLDGKKISAFPSCISDLERCKPVYEEFEGWRKPLDGVRLFKDLPMEARRFIRRIEEVLNCPVYLISVGPGREQTIEVHSVL